MKNQFLCIKTITQNTIIETNFVTTVKKQHHKIATLKKVT